jgi:hypothetical protein
MKYLPLIWKSLWRRKVRTTFTLLSIFIAFLLFGILMTIRAAFSLGVDLAGLDRLILIHKISLVMPLPESYKGRLQSSRSPPTTAGSGASTRIRRTSSRRSPSSRRSSWRSTRNTSCRRSR